MRTGYAATDSETTSPNVDTLVRLRSAWRAFHTRQDRDNAEKTYQAAGVEHIDETELAALAPELRAKLSEFGREWERAIALSAIREGGSVYRVQFRVEIDSVVAFGAWIETRLGEHGASLFFESHGLGALDSGIWHADFYFALRSGEEPSLLAFTTAPGVRKLENIARVA